MTWITNLKYEDIFAKLNQFQAWLDSLNIHYEKGRLEELVRSIEQICKHYKEGTFEDLRNIKGDEYLSMSLVQAIPFIRIFNSFSQYKAAIPKRLISSALDGPFLSRQEVSGSSNVNPRNYLFELELAAELIEKGFTVTKFDDVQFSFESIKYNIQCKRLISAKGIQTNIHKAYTQLQSNFDGEKDQGIIALSIEKIIETDRKILFVNDSHEMKLHLERIMVKFKNKYCNCWNSFLDQRVVAILIAVKAVALIKDECMYTHCHPMYVIPIACNRFPFSRDYDRLKRLTISLG